MGMRYSALASLVVGLVHLLLLPAELFSQADFYQGKTITIIQGRDPGGTGDLRVRAVIPFLRKYIPGNPAVATEYMTGGGGRKATNQIFRSTRPDGLTIGNVGAGLVANAILAEPGIQYDLDKLIFLGSPNSATHYLFLTKKELGLDNLEKVRAYPGLRIGAQSVGHDIYMNGRLFAWILGLKEPRFVTGYSGPEIDVALLRREVDARAQVAAAILQRNPDWIEKKDVVEFHAIIEIPKGHQHPRFVHLPELDSLAGSERQRKTVAILRAMRLAGSPYILPPGTPKERVEVLQEAVRRVFRDPEFLREYKKLVAEEPTPLMPEEMEKAIREVPRDPEIVETFKKIAGAGALPPR